MPHSELAPAAHTPHIATMATKSSDSVQRKTGKSGARVLGRSAATGRYVLSPASKGASVSVKEVTAAVENLRSKQK